jgi:hypothetical protein
VGGLFSGFVARFGIMTKYTQKQLREMVKNGVAVDVTNAISRAEAVPEDYKKNRLFFGRIWQEWTIIAGLRVGQIIRGNGSK